MHYSGKICFKCYGYKSEIFHFTQKPNTKHSENIDLSRSAAFEHTGVQRLGTSACNFCGFGSHSLCLVSQKPNRLVQYRRNLFSIRSWIGLIQNG